MHTGKKKQSTFLDSMYRQYRNFMLNIARKYIGNPQACEDVFHNAFVCLIRNEERLKSLSDTNLQAYIFLATRHAAIDYLRKERKMNLSDLPDDVLTAILERNTKSQSVSQAPYLSVELYALLQELSVEDQTLLIGHYVIGLDTAELAQIVDCSPGALRTRLHRVKKRVYEKFTGSGLRLEDFF